MWMPRYNANTVYKESEPREIWIGYNIALAELVYEMNRDKNIASYKIVVHCLAR